MRLNGTEKVFKYLEEQGFALFWGSDFVDVVDMSRGFSKYIGTIYSDGKFKPCEGFPVKEALNFGLVKVGNTRYNLGK